MTIKNSWYDMEVPESMESESLLIEESIDSNGTGAELRKTKDGYYYAVKLLNDEVVSYTYKESLTIAENYYNAWRQGLTYEASSKKGKTASQLLDRFNQEYNFLYENRDNVAGFNEAVAWFDKNMSDPNVAIMLQQLLEERGDVISSDREAAAFAFAFTSFDASNYKTAKLTRRALKTARITLDDFSNDSNPYEASEPHYLNINDGQYLCHIDTRYRTYGVAKQIEGTRYSVVIDSHYTNISEALSAINAYLTSEGVNKFASKKAQASEYVVRCRGFIINTYQLDSQSGEQNLFEGSTTHPAHIEGRGATVEAAKRDFFYELNNFIDFGGEYNRDTFFEECVDGNKINFTLTALINSGEYVNSVPEDGDWSNFVDENWSGELEILQQVTASKSAGRDNTWITIPPGTYYLGDPCYTVNNDAWLPLLNTCNYFMTNPVGTLPDGNKVYSFGTKHGDGSYESRYGDSYNGFLFSVDSGMIGLVPVNSEYTHPNKNSTIVTFSSSEYCGYEESNGIITFGDWRIYTGDGDE